MELMSVAVTVLCIVGTFCILVLTDKYGKMLDETRRTIVESRKSLEAMTKIAEEY